ncbi:hypothetical protein GWI33_009120 [Rhynchophorus ferrugineus]|uniref:Uncharacterized protein n=1 Tax=Rhynchophorus ferrugineus TaxID=354439 RepID=A0A834IF70_RHYFE|nr:hypothetical protein GWI33_009120 [Rhynchophorus ferrugineus]
MTDPPHSPSRKRIKRERKYVTALPRPQAAESEQEQGRLRRRPTANASDRTGTVAQQARKHKQKPSS